MWCVCQAGCPTFESFEKQSFENYYVQVIRERIKRSPTREENTDLLNGRWPFAAAQHATIDGDYVRRWTVQLKRHQAAYS